MEQPIEQCTAETLTPLARLAVERPDMHLNGWQVETVLGGAQQDSVVQRITGVGVAGDEAIPWRLIRKTIMAGPKNSTDTQASHYWKREGYYYQSGIFDHLPAVLRAARCYACVEVPGNVQLFLEDVQDSFGCSDFGHGWPLDYYRTVARCLGQFNGAYLMGQPIPTAEWIPRRWLRTYLEESALNFALLFEHRDHPLLKRFLAPFPDGLLQRAWEDRHAMMDALDALPQTFCHQDAFCGNLFAEKVGGTDQLVAIDWSYAGPGALGTELAPLVFASPYGAGDQLPQLALDGYLEGLSDADWHGNPDLVRFGFYVACFWRYPIAAFIGGFIQTLIDEASYKALEQSTGMTMEELTDFGAQVNAWGLPYYHEAMRLKQILKL